MKRVYLILGLLILCLCTQTHSWRRRRRRRSCSPINCVHSAWSQASGCSKSCGGGTMLWRRNIVRYASCGGGCSNHLTEYRPCNTQCCPYNCALSVWSVYGPCSASCGSSGIQKRTRRITRSQGCGGSCPYPLAQQRACERKCCPVNCRVSSWSSFSICSATCGTSGVQTRTRTKRVTESCGGSCSHKFTEQRACNRKCCPVNCQVSSWSPFNSCSATCGTSGVQTRTRTKRVTELCGGICPHKPTEQRACNRKCCPINCQVSSWSPFNSCSATCGTSGVQTRTRTKRVTESCGGICPHKLTERRACNRKCCPINCQVSSWSSFSICSATCGTSGVQTRTRTKRVTESCGGSCPHKLKEQRSCNRKCCPVNCQQKWSSWSICYCNGRQKRTLVVTQQNRCGGKKCDTTKRETRKCRKRSRCMHGRCHFRRGICLCRPGYQGTLCNQRCAKGTYGRNCATKCSCKRGTCQRTNGRCICPLEYTGKRCHVKYRCYNDRYKCRLPRLRNLRVRNCILRYTSTSRTTLCPSKTHFALRCPSMPSCAKIFLPRRKGCQFYCFRKFSSAICCPRSGYRP